MRDLWKYTKVKENEVFKTVLIREFLTDFEGTVLCGAPHEEDTRTLQAAFLNPAYTLTLGTSDDLIKIRHVSEVARAEECVHADFENIVLEGDKAVRYDPAIEAISVSYTIRANRCICCPPSLRISKAVARWKSPKS